MARNVPKKSQAKLFKQWKRYLNDSRLSEDEIVRRAKSLTKKGMKPND
jgi:23S rRNA maturation mini-RNase III|tara:strand:- start:275 stop:418 length:144 start_codon:yes stop_codon:yes gene_type:complete